MCNARKADKEFMGMKVMVEKTIPHGQIVLFPNCDSLHNSDYLRHCAIIKHMKEAEEE